MPDFLSEDPSANLKLLNSAENKTAFCEQNILDRRFPVIFVMSTPSIRILPLLCQEPGINSAELTSQTVLRYGCSLPRPGKNEILLTQFSAPCN